MLRPLTQVRSLEEPSYSEGKVRLHKYQHSLASAYRTTRRHIPDDRTIDTRAYEPEKSLSCQSITCLWPHDNHRSHCIKYENGNDLQRKRLPNHNCRVNRIDLRKITKNSRNGQCSRTVAHNGHFSIQIRKICNLSTAKYCAPSRKVAGSIPDGVTEIFHWHNPFGRIMVLGVDSASKRNEYQEYFLGGKGGRYIGLTNLSPSCDDCLEIWEPQPPGTLKACPGL